MRATFCIRRFDPEKSAKPYWQEYEVDWEKSDVVLSALHDIYENQDGTLAYRYSCRGAICGSCAMRISGAAALACKTQIGTLDTSKPITLEPLLNSGVIKDLVVDQGPFFAALRIMQPWLDESAKDAHETQHLDELMTPQELDEYKRSGDCIMCQCCFSDCPKRQQDEGFAGPAACLGAYKHIYHPQEGDAGGRLKAACASGGVYDCDRHGNCVRVCPKDCRPMRAIMFVRQRAGREGMAASQGNSVGNEP